MTSKNGKWPSVASKSTPAQIAGGATIEHDMYATPQAQSTKLHDLALMPRTKEPSTRTPFREDRERHNGTEAGNGLLHGNGTEMAMKAS